MTRFGRRCLGLWNGRFLVSRCMQRPQILTFPCAKAALPHNVVQISIEPIPLRSLPARVTLYRSGENESCRLPDSDYQEARTTLPSVDMVLRHWLLHDPTRLRQKPPPLLLLLWLPRLAGRQASMLPSVGAVHDCYSFPTGGPGKEKVSLSFPALVRQTIESEGLRPTL